MIYGDGFNSQPAQEVKRGAKSIPIFRLSTHLGQAHVGQFKVDERWRHQSRAFQSLGDATASGSANTKAASAEASTTLASVTVGPHDGSRVSLRMEAEAAHLRQQFGGSQRLLGVDSLFDNGEQLALKRPMPPRCPLSKALDDFLGDVLDR